jgi:hypothetical protein
MIPRDDVAPAQWEAFGPFAVCEDLTEIVLAINRLGGLDAVEFVITKATLTRESLREAADRLKAVGLVDLAQLLRQHARRAKPRPPSFRERMRLGFHLRIAANSR